MKFRTAQLHRPSTETSWLLERLEARTLMDGAPLPALTDLQDPTYTVVRVKTTLGDVDLELFDGAAPLTVSAFVSRIARGDIDLSFFHRLVPGQVLEGGAFKFQEGAGLFEVPAGGPVAPEMARSNVARTIAMERVDAGDGSATARFFFNLGDNSATFDNPATGFSVFGRIANDASWSVVQAIGALPTADLDVRLGGSEGSRFDNVPVVESGDQDDDGDHNGDDGDHNGDDGDHGDHHEHDDDGPSTQSLVDITDIEVVKAQGSSEFYTHSVSYPEGFSGSTVDEFVPMVNPNDQPALYQVILRFEQDPANPFSRRDSVVATGTIAPNSRGGIDVWHGMTDFPGTPDSPVTPGRPYAIEVRSTLGLAATLSHYDFGVATGESFSSAPSTNWVITDGVKGSGAFDFLVWYNPSGETAHIHLTFSPEGQATTPSLDVDVGAYRRGGLNISLLDILPEGRFATKIESSEPLVAAVSHYQPGEHGQGYTSIGASGTSQELGVVANAAFGSTIDQGTATLSFLNPASGPILGPAVDYAVFAFNADRLKIGGHSTVNGNVGFDSTKRMDVSGHSVITGRLDTIPGADVRVHGHSQVEGGTFTVDLQPAADAAASASSTLAAEAATQSLDDITDRTGTLDGNGGLNVIQVAHDIKLGDHRTLTLHGTAADVFVFNVYGKMSLGGDSTIVLDGVTASHVLFNLVGEHGKVKIGGHAAAVGTILAPWRSLKLGGHATLTGALIDGGRKMSISGHSTVDFAPFDLGGGGGDGPAVIDLTLHFEDHDLADVHLPAALTLAPGRSGTVRLDSSVFDVTPYLGQRFTVTYTSSHPVFAGMSQSDRFDGVSTGVAVQASMNSQFGEGFMDPARAGTEVFETVAVYNPFTASAHPGAQDAHITLTFRYTDGFVVSVDRTIGGGDTAFVDLNAMPEILAQGTDNHRYFYSTQVTSDVPVVAQLTHLDTNLGRPGNRAGDFSTLGTTFGDSPSLAGL